MPVLVSTLKRFVISPKKRGENLKQHEVTLTSFTLLDLMPNSDLLPISDLKKLYKKCAHILTDSVNKAID